MAGNRRLDDLVAEWEPRLRKAFLAAVDAITGRVRIADIVRALERGDIIGAIDAVGIDRAAWRRLEIEVEAAFADGGDLSVARIPALRGPIAGYVNILFDVRNPRAEARMRNHSSGLVTAISNDQREALRIGLTAGLERGDNPQRVALDLIGRINPVTRKREGGIVGLTAMQEQWVQNYAAELADPEKATGALERALRDKRFDPTVRKAIAEGKAIPLETRRKMVVAYRNRALKLRGDTIGRTEAIRALHEGADEGFRQAIDAGQVQQQNVYKVWHSAGDLRVRDSHRQMNGQRVKFEASFVSPSGAVLRYPGDPDAPASETVNCRCWAETRVDFLAGLK